jgi:hypothetical protein
MFQACVCPLLVQPHKYPSDGVNRGSRSANVVLRAPVMADYTSWHFVTQWSSGQEFQVSSRRNDRPAVRVPGVNLEAASASGFSTPGRSIPFTRFLRHLAHCPDMFFSLSLTMPYLMSPHVSLGRHRVISCCICFFVLLLELMKYRSVLCYKLHYLLKGAQTRTSRIIIVGSSIGFRGPASDRSRTFARRLRF